MSIQTVSYAEMDRMFYEKLRLSVVAMGLLPDVTLYSSESTWFAARAVLKATLEGDGLTMVDVIGVGSWDDKDEKTDARIVIIRQSTSIGSVGGGQANFYDQKVGPLGQALWDKYRYPDSTDNVQYEIRLMTDNVHMERTLSSIVNNTLGRRRYVQTVDDTGAFTDKAIMLINNGSFDLSDQRYIEKGYKYVVEDVFLQEPELVKANIPLLSTIHYCVYLPDTDNPDAQTCFDLSVEPEITSGFPYPLPITYP